MLTTKSGKRSKHAKQAKHTNRPNRPKRTKGTMSHPEAWGHVYFGYCAGDGLGDVTSRHQPSPVPSPRPAVDRTYTLTLCGVGSGQKRVVVMSVQTLNEGQRSGRYKREKSQAQSVRVDVGRCEGKQTGARASEDEGETRKEKGKARAAEAAERCPFNKNHQAKARRGKSKVRWSIERMGIRDRMRHRTETRCNEIWGRNAKRVGKVRGWQEINLINKGVDPRQRW
ncbi:hypothetical protein EDB86DRAFT_3216928 [Lactarius hatsudake]|nr:hypothetical protein EDB86DRAFT_3216928 [Lactarius hatsudake]